jgi:hypothetical protein
MCSAARIPVDVGWMTHNMLLWRWECSYIYVNVKHMLYIGCTHEWFYNEKVRTESIATAPLDMIKEMGGSRALEEQKASRRRREMLKEGCWKDYGGLK